MGLLAVVLVAGCSSHNSDSELFYQALTKQTVEAQMRNSVQASPVATPVPIVTMHVPIAEPTSTSISPDVIARYEKLTGRHINRKHLSVPVMKSLTGVKVAGNSSTLTIPSIADTAHAMFTAIVKKCYNCVATLLPTPQPTATTITAPIQTKGFITQGMVLTLTFIFLIICFLIVVLPKWVEYGSTKANKWMNRK